MTYEELKNIENMTLKEVCEFLDVKPSTLIAKNLACAKCPLEQSCYGDGDWYACKSILEKHIKTSDYYDEDEFW